MLERLREWVRPFYLRQFYFPLFPARKPPYFSTCWQFPDAGPDRGPPETPTILFWPMNDWHTRLQRTQQLALALSRRGYRCIYLNPHLGREFPRRFQADRSIRLNRLAANLFELHVHLPREPVFHHRPLTAAESERLADAVTALLRDLGNAPLVQILAFPVWLDAAQCIRERHNAPLFYDCHDYLPGFPGIAPAILDREPDTFRASDRIIASSVNLMERAAAFAAHVPAILLRNAASVELLQVARAPRSPITIGYSGALDFWFDCASVRAAALAHPEWRFQLIGRIENEDVAKLAQIPNVEFAGEIPFEGLAPFLAGFSVAMIPFVLNPLIAATDPIKAYEYLAVGLPVVSAWLPELDRFADVIDRYRDPTDFIRKLERALATDSASRTASRRAAAETWDQRADVLAALIEQAQPPARFR